MRSEKTDIAIRVIVDHIRAVAFTIADGQLPSNNGAGYVIRRILRRAVRYGFSFLNLKEPFFNQLVPVLAKEFGDTFPEIRQQQDFVQKVILEEENSFLRTLENGLKKLNTWMDAERDGNTIRFKSIEAKDLQEFEIEMDYIGNDGVSISGKGAFLLYDTFGFPIDLTELIAKENSWSVDIESFKQLLQEVRDNIIVK